MIGHVVKVDSIAVATVVVKFELNAVQPIARAANVLPVEPKVIVHVARVVATTIAAQNEKLVVPIARIIESTRQANRARPRLLNEPRRNVDRTQRHRLRLKNTSRFARKRSNPRQSVIGRL